MEQTRTLLVGLGAGLNPAQPGDPPYKWIGDETELRAAAVAKLWRQAQGMIIFSGGGIANPAAPSEAATMEDYVRRPPWDVPADRILTDSTSIDTASNVRNVVAIIKERALPTSGIQLVAGRTNAARAAAYFRAYGVHVTPLLARQVLGDDIERLGLPTVSDTPTLQARFNEFLLRLEQLIDRKGLLVTWFKRRRRGM